ncbi:MAG: AI-2E family transporter [Kiritimatiellae bacterium]|nr:AI-2E family transporter [Kiritimatiellia bacterium]
MIEFGDNQKKTIANGLTMLSLALVFAFIAFVAWGALKALSYVSSAIVPVVLGFFLSLFFKPYYRWWVKIVRNPTLALVVMLATVFIPLGIFVWYAGSVMADQISNLIAQGPQLVAKVTEWFRATFPKARMLLDNLGVPYEDVAKLYTNYGGAAAKAGSGALKCLSTLVTSIVSLIFFVFFLMAPARTGGEIVHEMPFLKDETKLFVAEQIDAFVRILVSFFQRQTLICLIEGVMYGTGFALVGLPYGFLIGFALGVLNLIPLFGSLVCLPVALPLAYFGHDGSATRLVLVLIVWGLGQLADGYFITPRIQGDKTGLGYAGVIFSFFFWATVLGPILGMLLAIPLSAFCTVLWRALKSKYIKPLV